MFVELKGSAQEKMCWHKNRSMLWVRGIWVDAFSMPALWCFHGKKKLSMADIWFSRRLSCLAFYNFALFWSGSLCRRVGPYKITPRVQQEGKRHNSGCRVMLCHGSAAGPCAFDFGTSGLSYKVSGSVEAEYGPAV